MVCGEGIREKGNKADVQSAVQLEMILQASEYEAAQGLSLQEFFDSTAGRFKTETGKAWAAEIVGRRTARIGGQAQQS